jgi:hypothetical protein
LVESKLVDAKHLSRMSDHVRSLEQRRDSLQHAVRVVGSNSLTPRSACIHLTLRPALVHVGAGLSEHSPQVSAISEAAARAVVVERKPKEAKRVDVTIKPQQGRAASPGSMSLSPKLRAPGPGAELEGCGSNASGGKSGDCELRAIRMRRSPDEETEEHGALSKENSNHSLVLPGPRLKSGKM